MSTTTFPMLLSQLHFPICKSAHPRDGSRGPKHLTTTNTRSRDLTFMGSKRPGSPQPLVAPLHTLHGEGGLASQHCCMPPDIDTSGSTFLEHYYATATFSCTPSYPSEPTSPMRRTRQTSQQSIDSLLDGETEEPVLVRKSRRAPLQDVFATAGLYAGPKTTQDAHGQIPEQEDAELSRGHGSKRQRAAMTSIDAYCPLEQRKKPRTL